MKIREAFEEGLIPKYYLDYLPLDCPDCGQPLEISKKLTRYRCDNKDCINKRAKRLDKFLTGVGIKNFGPELAYQYFKKNPEATILSILLDDKDNYPDKMSSRRKSIYKNKFRELREINLKYKELVRLLDMPKIDKDALKIFRGINSFEEYKRMIKHYGDVFTAVKARLDMKSLKRPKYIANTLILYEDDIKMIEEVFTNIKHDNGKYQLVAMTGIPANYKDKEEFLREQSDILGVDLELSGSLEDSVLVIYSRKGTETYREAYSKYRDKLITPEHFKKVVKEAVENG